MEAPYNPFSEELSHWIPTNVPIKISEVCPAPLEGLPEWFEITNPSSKKFSLHNIQYNKQPLLSQSHTSSSPYYIGPKQSIVVTSKESLFQKAYPFLQVPILEHTPWDILKNTADTILLLTPNHRTIDSMSYPDNTRKIIAKEGQCYIPNPIYISDSISPNTPKWILADATPGYRQPPPSTFSWSIKPRIINKDKGEQFEIVLKIPPLQEASAYILDLSGHKVITLCKPCTGKVQTYWKGASSVGKPVPIGPYVLLIKRAGYPAIKQLVIVGKQL